ncbi:hypothetical protein EDD16DRAFT_1657508 [Pisolithus croceorrhizus]|nr:hypothetical protein EDD16DRAFT_1657508 [Pisolithus croceorrhizus]
MAVLDVPWTLTADQILEHFGVDPSTGLSKDQARRHADIYGRNELPEAPPTPLWELIIEQFKDQLVLILLGSAVISFVLALFEDPDDSTLFGAFVEPAVILLILVANAAVGVIQETSAEKAIEALKEYSPDEAKVLRSGQLVRVHAVELVPGDIISVSVGDRVPADCRILSISSKNFRVDQAILTGESVSVNKSFDVVEDDKAVKQDMTNMLFAGTTVVNGRARAIVTSIGEKTAIGHIYHSISQQISEKTPLKRKLDDFGEMLAKVISVICILVWLVNFRHFWDPSHHGVLKGAVYYLKIAVALAVAAIPEGLAAVITACLALGTKKMAQKNAIVRNLPSVETLGCTNVICSDKTGTLTTNQMSVSKFLVFDSDSSAPRDYDVEGTTYSPHGVGAGLALDPIRKLAEISAVCNDAKIVYHAEKETYLSIGEPTEAALKVLSLPTLPPSLRASAVSGYFERNIPRLYTLEFSRDRKDDVERCTSVLVHGKVIPLTAELRNVILARTLTYGTSGLRTLAMAYVNVSDLDPSHYESNGPEFYTRFERDLTFVPVANCKAAGIRVVCVTGDNKGTAEAILERVIPGPTEEKVKAVQRASLFSRTEPGHKSQLVDLLQGLGLVVAMTGDGVNDAPALKKADIGVAMGSGTDLADSNFATIELAVEEGRLIYNNTKQFIRYLISSNIGEVVSSGTCATLWVNLVTDSLPATALGFNPADHSIMRMPPRNSREPLVGKWLFFRYLVVGFYVGCAYGVRISFYQLTHFHQCSAVFPEIGCEMFTNEMSRRATTMSLSILVTVEMFNAMNSLSENESLLRLPVWKNPYLVAAITLSMVLHVGILYIPFFTWKAVLKISAPVLAIDELLKFITATFVDPPTRVVLN